MSIRADIERARTTPSADLRLAGEAWAWLAVLRLGVALLPLQRVAHLLGFAPTEPSSDDPEGMIPGTKVEDRIGWALRAASARTPWASTCLVQSLAGLAMLRVRRLEGTVYLGVAKTANGDVAAHSWLRCGDRVVTGGGNRAMFTALAAYRLRQR